MPKTHWTMATNGNTLRCFLFLAKHINNLQMQFPINVYEYINFFWNIKKLTNFPGNCGFLCYSPIHFFWSCDRIWKKKFFWWNIQFIIYSFVGKKLYNAVWLCRQEIEKFMWQTINQMKKKLVNMLSTHFLRSLFFELQIIFLFKVISRILYVLCFLQKYLSHYNKIIIITMEQEKRNSICWLYCL